MIDFAPKGLKTPFRRLMEITSAVPSVVYGWLALYYLVPAMERVAHRFYGEETQVGGEGLASAAFLLGVMIVPTVTILSLDALSRVSQSLVMPARRSAPRRYRRRSRWSSLARGGGCWWPCSTGSRARPARRWPCRWSSAARDASRRTPFSPTTTISTQIVMDMQNAMPGSVASDALYAMALVLLVISSGVVL